MRMTTALQHQDSVLLAPVQEPVRGWSIRPGTFRVARPYDTTAIATTDTAIESMSSLAQSESQQPPHDSEDSRLRKRQRISKRAANCFQDPENDTVQWIESEFFPLINETVAQTLVREMRNDHFYGTFVHAPASHAFALDFVQLRPTLRLLRSGFQSTFDNVRENEPRRSSRKDRAYQQDAIVFPEIHLSTGLQQLDLGDIYESAVVNDNSDPAIISFPSDGCPHYVIPPHSGFSVSDFDKIHGLTSIARERGGFDIIVMDPPWQNASVDRMAHYDTLDLYDLFKIPIPELLRVKRDKKTEEESHQDGVVAVWITNRAKVKRIVVEKLFPAWGLELVAQWYWLKVK
ncbi:Methyltransferase-like protein 4 [Dissophora globulifera]|nr:Methyltransferase-like protein 4 [Dissophora globulifera]